MERATYEQVRDRLAPGDVIAFRGDNWFSRLVAWMGGRGVSHVGLITWRAEGDQEPEFWDSNLSLKHSEGKVTSPVNPRPPGRRNGPGAMSFRTMYDTYDGAIWWLPIHPALTATQEDALDGFSYGADKRRFDIMGGVRQVVHDFLQRRFGFREAWRPVQREVEDYFCSKLVAEGLLHAGVVDARVDPNVTPGTICGWRIYRGEYWLLKGSGKISRFNRKRPAKRRGAASG
jgi:hypothetical protein